MNLYKHESGKFMPRILQLTLVQPLSVQGLPSVAEFCMLQCSFA